jgi:hypothetical protein
MPLLALAEPEVVVPVSVVPPKVDTPPCGVTTVHVPLTWRST